jgi:hypothetical protein
MDLKAGFRHRPRHRFAPGIFTRSAAGTLGDRRLRFARRKYAGCEEDSGGGCSECNDPQKQTDRRAALTVITLRGLGSVR